MTLNREWGLIPSGGVEQGARVSSAQEEVRLSVRSTRLAVGTLACDRCDAPVAIGDHALAPSDPITCPYCRRRASVRDFLSIGEPVRPARVVVRVRHASVPLAG